MSRTPAPARLPGRPATVADARVRRIKALAELLDSAVKIPLTPIRFGLDAVLGLVPGVGDALGTAMSGFIMLEAARSGASRRLILRMLYNVGIDAVAGVIPFVGDVLDIFWKANDKNVRLFERHVHDPVGTKAATGWFFAGIAVVLAAIAVGVVVGAVWAIAALVRLGF